MPAMRNFCAHFENKRTLKSLQVLIITRAGTDTLVCMCLYTAQINQKLLKAASYE